MPVLAYDFQVHKSVFGKDRGEVGVWFRPNVAIDANAFRFATRAQDERLRLARLFLRDLATALNLNASIVQAVRRLMADRLRRSFFRVDAKCQERTREVNRFHGD